MKKSEIVLGGVYHNGKGNRYHEVRKVIAEGPEYTLYSGQTETDNLRYEVVSIRRLGHQGNITRTSFAAWAKGRFKDE